MKTITVRDSEVEIDGRWVPLVPANPDDPLGYVVFVGGRVYDLAKSFATRWPGIPFEPPDDGFRLVPYNVAQMPAR